MEISRPIFIIGVARSGTTLLYYLMAQHRDLAWFSQYDRSKMFSKEFLKFYKLRKRLYDIRTWSHEEPILAHYDLLFDVPIEFPTFWNHYIGKDWTSDKDVDDSAQVHLRDTISEIIKEKKRKRFLSKYPRNSVRIRFLNRVFPGSIFINIVRDGRAVVASMLKLVKNENLDYFGIPLRNGNQTEFDLLEAHALQWVQVLEEINDARNYLKPEQYFEIKYEDLVSDPKMWLKKIFSFCDLKQENVFENEIKRVLGKRRIEIISEKLSNRNKFSKNDFSQAEINRLNKIMKKPLERFEYL